jgi:hypothetical protein
VGLQPYRDASGKPKPAELVYRTRDPERLVAPTRAAAQVWIAGTLVSSILVMAGLRGVAAVLFGVAAICAVWRWRRTPYSSGVVIFRIDCGFLDVTAPAYRTLVRAPLDEISNVSLDTKNIRKVVEGSAITPGIRSFETKVSPGVDVARILVMVEGLSEPVRLSDSYYAHMECVEWLGRIRKFLRSNGWAPEDERESGPYAPSSEPVLSANAGNGASAESSLRFPDS